MLQVQILQAENESADQGPPTPPLWLNTIREHLAAGSMCVHVCVCNLGGCVHVVCWGGVLKLIQICVNTRDQILECVPLVPGAPD